MLKQAIMAMMCVTMPTIASAQSAQKCLTQDQADGLATFALPATIKLLARKCSATLPATTYLIQGGPVQAGLYQNEAELAWPVARAAFDRLSGTSLSRLLSDPIAKSIIEANIGAAITDRLKPADCGTVDRLMTILQPLPAKNMAMLITLVMDIAAKRDKASSPLTICPEPVEK